MTIRSFAVVGSLCVVLTTLTTVASAQTEQKPVRTFPNSPGPGFSMKRRAPAN